MVIRSRVGVSCRSALFLVLVSLLAWLLLACTGNTAQSTGAGSSPTSAAVPSPTSVATPRPAAMERVPIDVQRATLQDTGANQSELLVEVVLPDACSQPRWAVSRDGTRVLVEVWGERPVDVACAQVLREETLTIPLGVALHDGWVVALNGVQLDPGEGIVHSSEPGTGGYDSGLAIVEQVEVRVGEGTPAAVTIEVQGALPDACAELAESPSVTVEGQRITVLLEWQRPRDRLCAQVLRPFTRTIEVGSFAPGTYTLVVNDMETSFTIEPDQS